MGENHEYDNPSAEVKWLGPLGGEQPDPEIWKGSISAKPVLVAERFDAAAAEVPSIVARLRALAETKFRSAKWSAAVRCIDGRGESEQPDTTDLGPQVPGGTPVMALCYRLANWKVGQTIDEDLEEFKSLIVNLPYPPGAHEDESNEHNEEKTGCGAIDKMLDILDVMANGELMLPYVKAVIGNDIPDEVIERKVQDIGVKLEILQGRHFRDRYFMKDPSSGKHRFGKVLINRVKKAEQDQQTKTVEKLAGEHKELLLLINKVRGQTFDRDGFSAESGGRAQAFNYDVWHAVDRARAVYAEDEVAQQTMIVANVMYAVATAVALTDGTLELGIRDRA